MSNIRTACLLVGLMAAASAHATPVLSTFEELSLPTSSHYFPEASTPFSSGLATFSHHYNSDWGNWSGWVYSNETDTTTEGYDNQFSVYNSGGADGSDTYALAYVASYDANPAAITFDGPVVVDSVSLTNTTYAALSMAMGDMFAKKFGGDSGDDADWFKLSIIGKDTLGAITGTVDVYLADFRFADNSQDYILDQWTTVNLSGLGAISSLEFALSSSDTSAWGMNTPAYFALDNLSLTAAVPEASSVLMSLAGLAVLLTAGRRRAKA